jgi:hypothetical protein
LRLFERSQMIFEDDLAKANRPTASALLQPAGQSPRRRAPSRDDHF